MSLERLIPNKEKALMLAKKQLSEFVCDAVNLEGIHYTLPEIQTLLDGITVGGHSLSDQQIALNQASAWKQLFHWVEANTFILSKEIACQLHGIAGYQEALSWGNFRKGGVTIAGTDYLPPAADKLPDLWTDMIAKSYTLPLIYDRAIFIFLTMSRIQFFYDVNKRMGRFMMNGLLISEGYPAINLPAKNQLEFNQLMLAFYSSGDTGPMTEFMKRCLSVNIIRIMSEV